MTQRVGKAAQIKILAVFAYIIGIHKELGSELMFEAETPGILARQRIVGFDRYTTKLATKLGKQALRLVIRKRGLAGILPNDRLEVGNDTLEVGC